MSQRTRSLLFVLECSLGATAVTGVAYFCHWSSSLRPIAVLLYILVIVPVALLSGFWQSVIVSLVAVILQQRLFSAASTRTADSITLAAFIVTALVVSRLSARMNEHADAAETWGVEMSELYALSRAMLSISLNESPGPALAAMTREIFQMDAVLLFVGESGEVASSGVWGEDAVESAICAYRAGKPTVQDSGEVACRVIRLRDRAIGSVLMRGQTRAETNDAIASLMAVSFDRHHAFLNECRIAALHRAEELRTTVLDDFAHASKTPLTAILAASSGLESLQSLSPEERDLARLIEEQATVLGDLTNRVLTLARTDAEEIRLQLVNQQVSQLLADVAAGFPEPVRRRRLKIDVPGGDPVLRCDHALTVSLLTQFVDNALKYGAADTPITISAQEEVSEVVFAVHNIGPVIPVTDLERLFTRSFRGESSSAEIPGTGVGLSIAQRAARLQHGAVWVRSEEDGTTFFASIPNSAKGAARTDDNEPAEGSGGRR